jgi:hypothetical protein
VKSPTVVHVRFPFHVYIGYPSKWANPYRTGRDGTRTEVLEKYEEHARKNLMDDLGELDGQVLGCHCEPRPCHGHVLVRLFNERFGVS